MILTSKDLAERWKMTEQMLRHWRIKNKGPQYFKLGEGKKSAVRYRLEDVQEWEKKHDVSTSSGKSD